MSEIRRKRNRLGAGAYRGRGAYFLTLCVQDRKRIFDGDAVVDAVLGVLKQACEAHAFCVYAYCFMPDHLHLIVVGECDASNLAGMMKAFKGAATAAGRKCGVGNLWQKGFYDHVLRDGEGMDEAAWYVFQNPVRAGLVKRAEEWKYSGSFVFEWRKMAVPAEAFRPVWKEGLGKEKIRGEKW